MSELPELIDLLADTLASLRSVVAGLPAEQWQLPTGCPGWSVADNVSHIIGMELDLEGGGAELATEPAVTLRRGRSPAELLEEYDEVTTRRLAALRSEIVHPAFDPDARVPSHFGPLPFASLLRLRTFDVFAHLQDVRRAVAVPGDLDGPAMALAVRNILRGMASLAPRIPDLETKVVTVEVDGAPWQVDYRPAKPVVSAGRAEEADVVLAVGASNLLALGCGRSDADPDAVTVRGDAALGAAILASMAVTP